MGGLCMETYLVFNMQSLIHTRYINHYFSEPSYSYILSCSRWLLMNKCEKWDDVDFGNLVYWCCIFVACPVFLITVFRFMSL